jgi:hypothetical protein
MNRKEFLRAGGCCAALALLKRAAGETPAASTPAAPTPPPAGLPLTSAEERVAFAERWAKRFFDVLDATVDQETREKLMRANGRACHEGSLQRHKQPTATVDQFVEFIRSHHGPESARREGDTVYFNYIQNFSGLKVADGYCLCPLVETGPAGLSGTYCFCSVGYVQHMFELMAGHPVKVALLDSLKRGGKGCKFKIDLV